MKTIKNTTLLFLFALAFTACTENNLTETEELNDLNIEVTDNFTGDESEVPNGSKE